MLIVMQPQATEEDVRRVCLKDVHPQLDHALSDGYQSLFQDQFASLME